jgi:hypothetical protein
MMSLDRRISSSAYSASLPELQSPKIDDLGGHHFANSVCDTTRLTDSGSRIGIARRDGAYYPVIMRTISLKLSDELLAQLASAARTRRVTKSQVVRESLARALQEKPPAGSVSCYDLARDLAGSVKGLPKDLANNPKYMRGFGE